MERQHAPGLLSVVLAESFPAPLTFASSLSSRINPSQDGVTDITALPAGCALPLSPLRAYMGQEADIATTLAQFGEQMLIPSAAVIFDCGEPGDGAYVVISGEICVL